MIKHSSLIKNAYYTLLDHFSKEEQVLYPMAERCLHKKKKKSSMKKYHEFNKYKNVIPKYKQARIH